MRRRDAWRTLRRETGLSLIEVLIAAAVLLLITIGVLPLFTRSIVNNFTGDEYTHAVNHARSRLESLNQLPFNSPDLTVPDGDTELVVEEFWDSTDEVWKTGTPGAGDTPRWLRTVTVRQYSISDLDDDDELNNPLPGGVLPTAVHIKEIEVLTRSIHEGSGTALGPGKQTTLRIYKPF